MAFTTLNDRQDDVLAEINMIPLIDVMLVLLIVFIITIPVIHHAVKVQLPTAAAARLREPPEAIRVSVDADGQVFWNQERLDGAALEARLAQAARRDPQPELHLRADKAVAYEHVARTMAAAQRQGLHKLGFVTTP